MFARYFWISLVNKINRIKKTPYGAAAAGTDLEMI